MDRCGNYLLKDGRSLGQGSFGEVFKVDVYNLTQTHMTTYARKYFSPCPDFDKTAIKELTDLRQRFLVEIKTQCTLNRINYDSIAPIVYLIQMVINLILLWNWQSVTYMKPSAMV